MKILIVAATAIELENLHSKVNFIAISHNVCEFTLGSITISTYIVGVGVTNMAIGLSWHLKDNSYDLCINMGIAGAYKQQLELLEIVRVVEDCYADIGIEESNGDILTLNESKLHKSLTSEILREDIGASTMIENYFNNIKKVRGVTVPYGSGSLHTLNRRNYKYKGDVETMEGASFFEVCNVYGLQCIQIRSISNYVQVRDTSKWKLHESIDNLANFTFGFLLALT